MNEDTAANHFDTHMRLLSKYRSLNGARYGSMTAGGLLSTVLLSAPDPGAIAVGLTGLALLPIGYLVKFPAEAASRSLKANWKKAFSGATWRTVGGEIGVVTETDEYGNDIRLSFHGKVSNETFGLSSLEPASDKARQLAPLLEKANPYDKTFHPVVRMFCLAAATIAGMAVLPLPLAIVWVWLAFSTFCYLMCGFASGISSDNDALLRRVAKSKWQTLDGRIGVVRAADRRGNGDSGWVDYLTIGFDDGSEHRAEKSEMNPVHS